MSGIEHYTPPEGYLAIAEATRPMLAFMRELKTVDDLEPMRELDYIDAERHLDRAKSIIARFPNLPDLRQKQLALEDAVTQRASEIETAPVIAGMLGAIPTAAKNASPSYVEALLTEATAEEDDLDAITYMGSKGFSLPVIMLTAREIVRTKTFAPSVAEFSATARKVRRDLRDAWCVTRHLVMRREEAAAIVRIIEDPLPDDPNELPF